MKPIIYIAAPYSNGEMNSGKTPEKIIMDNIINSLRVGNELADAGFIPFAGNLYHYWHMAYPRDYESWFEIVTAHLPHCKAVLRLEGLSSGADREVEMANKLGIPVFYDIQTLIKYFKGENNASN